MALAAEKGHVEVLELLLANGANSQEEADAQGMRLIHRTAHGSSGAHGSQPTRSQSIGS